MVGLVVLLAAYMIFLMIAVDLLIVLFKFRKEFKNTMYDLIAQSIYALIFIVLEIPKLIISCIVGTGAYLSVILIVMWILIFLFYRYRITTRMKNEKLPPELLVIDVTTTICLLLSLFFERKIEKMDPRDKKSDNEIVDVDYQEVINNDESENNDVYEK